MEDKLRINQEEIDRLTFRSDEMNEIMESVPSKLTRYGITIILVVIFIILLSSFYFRYPDTINGSFVIQSSNPPLTIKAKVNGKVEKLCFSERDTVKSGDLVVVMSSSANYEDIFQIKNLLKIDSLLPFVDTFNLGEVQSVYIEYGKSLLQYEEYESLNYYEVKIKALEELLKQKGKQIELYKESEEYNRKSLEIQKHLHKIDSSMIDIGGISLKDIQKGEQTIIQMEESLNASRIAYSNTEMAIIEYSNEIKDLNIQKMKEERRIKDDLRAAIENLKSALNTWENNYCLYSDINGIITYKDIWNVFQNVTSGQDLLSIIPIEESNLLIRVFIPLNNAGKIKEGNWTNLVFNDYPEDQFGLVRCRLGKLSLMPDSNYTSTFFLDYPLVTNYGKTLEFKQNMSGIATIITEDLSLFQRFINPIRASLQKYKFVYEKK